MTAPKRSQKKYLIKEDNEVYLVSDKYFSDIASRNEAINIGMQIYLEIQRTLKEDALNKDVSYVGNTKVTTALNRSLDALEERYPLILREILSIEKRLDGLRVFKA